MSVDTSAIAKIFGAISAANVVPAIITFVISYFVLKIVVKVVGNLLDRTPMEKTIVRFIRSSLHIVMWVLISVITASALGIDTTSMVALISVASLAVSLAVQGALSNLAGGVTLLSTHPFRVGDFVEVGGVSGTVRSNYTLSEILIILTDNNSGQVIYSQSYSGDGELSFNVGSALVPAVQAANYLSSFTLSIQASDISGKQVTEQSVFTNIG